MPKPSSPTTIKKYANRRLYNTGTSTYVTLEDLATMIKTGEEFVVVDAKSNEDITRTVLTQIIFEQEGKNGHQLLPIDFLRQLIRFYGDSMQSLVPGYLQMSLESFVREQEKLRETMARQMGGTWPANGFFGALEEQTRKNMAAFEKALSVFSPFQAQKTGSGSSREAEIESLRGAMADMQAKIDKMARGE